MMQKFMSLLLMVGLFLLAACTTINYTSSHIDAYEFKERWGIAPFTNNTDMVEAGPRATAITAALMRTHGITHLTDAPFAPHCNQLLSCPNKAVPLEKIRAWANQRHLRYVMLGAVNEWQYKVGLDGEPVAALTLQVYDAAQNKIIWSAAGSKTGSSHSGLGNIAQELINRMLNSLIQS